jgi:hypothetical protein
MMEKDIPDSSRFSGKISQIPPDLVVKSQPIDIIDVSLRLI